MSTIDPSVSIAVFFDGGYVAKVNQAIEEQFNVRINFRKLFEFLKKKIAAVYQIDFDDCHIVEAHYFRGRFRADDADANDLLYSERRFEDTLIENDVIFHYKHLRSVEGKEYQVIEKGIDVWFALEAYEQALYRKFDVVVLMTGDADHEMLVKKLKAIKTRVVLLTWDTGVKSSTAKLLREEACKHFEISELNKKDAGVLHQICNTLIQQ